MESARPATSADLQELVRLARDGIGHQRGVRGGLLWADREARAEPLEQTLAADLADDEVFVVVGEVDGVPLAYGVVRRERLRSDEVLAVVTDLWVEPEARGVGLGEVVMDHLVAWAESEGCLGIDAMALPGDRATKNFFESFGLKARAIVVHRSLREG